MLVRIATRIQRLLQRRGLDPGDADVFQADPVVEIVLGAQMLEIGRLACCGLAAAGQAGLVHVFELLEEEIRLCMGFLGVDRLAAVARRISTRRCPSGPRT